MLVLAEIAGIDGDCCTVSINVLVLVLTAVDAVVVNGNCVVPFLTVGDDTFSIDVNAIDIGVDGLVDGIADDNVTTVVTTFVVVDDVEEVEDNDAGVLVVVIDTEEHTRVLHPHNRAAFVEQCC